MLSSVHHLDVNARLKQGSVLYFILDSSLLVHIQITMKKSLLGILLVFFAFVCATAQSQNKLDVVQFSGVVTFEDGEDIYPLPGATVGVVGTSRGTVTEIDGFFSLVVLKGEEVEIRFLGLKPARFAIPDSAKTYYSIVINLEKDVTQLPVVEILPIPSREFFKQDFLAMEIENPFLERARENLGAGLMAEIRENLPVDGTEAARMELKSNAASYYSYGQFKPQNVLNPFAWKKFIEAWKRGDYKRKKKKDK